MACVVGAVFNGVFSAGWIGFESGLLLRFAVGLCLAGIYPLGSSNSARSCPPQWVGSALAIQNSIGFLITIVSITLLLSVIEVLGSTARWILLPGPILGLMGMWPLLKKIECQRCWLNLQVMGNHA